METRWPDVLAGSPRAGRWHWARYHGQWRGLAGRPESSGVDGVQLVVRVGRGQADMRGIKACSGTEVIGRLDFQLCHRCRAGWIRRVYVDEPQQRRGIGEAMLMRAVSEGRGYRWDTAGQSRFAAGFWSSVKARSGLPFDQLAHQSICPHMRDARTDDPVRPWPRSGTW